VSSGPAIAIREVGPRDGLQSERVVAPADRLRLIHALAAAGLRDIEVASFVSPRAVPAMAGADEVVAGLPNVPDARWWALVPNARGAELATAAGVRWITVTVSASTQYSLKNVGVELEDALRGLTGIARALDTALDIDVVISCAFGSPFGDVTSAGETADVADRVRSLITGRITLADTTGTATPRRIREVLDAVGTDVGLHLHDTRGTALANALSAIELGVRSFDTSVGGLGGSPFAPGAGGNLATEDFALVLEDEGVATGIDLDALLRAAEVAAELVGHAVPSRVAAAGPLSPFEQGARR
jgi:hydroxymethylglutaryl-CoA lyase